MTDIDTTTREAVRAARYLPLVLGPTTHLRLVHPHLPTLPPLRHIRRRESNVRTGCLFSGYGGLSIAVNAYFGATTAWFSEFDTAPSRILAHHWPDVPNHGDITHVDWSSVEPVDILCGGFPCQDVSAAGRRAGIREGTRSGLWSYFAEAINQLRPRYVVVENVRGLLSAKAYRPMEPEPDAVGDRRTGPVLRALGAVLGDLWDLGYDAQWCTVAAADVGACHKRERVFIVATPSDTARESRGLVDRECAGTPSDAECGGRDGWSRDEVGRPGRRTTPAGGGEGGSGGEAVALLPTPVASDWERNAEPAELDRHSPSLGAISHLLPPPRATDGTKGGPNQRGSSGDLMLPSAVHLLPTPQSRDHKGVPSDGFNTANLCRDVRDIETTWGPYETAIRRAELACGRPAPAPTEPNRNGNPRLSSAFAEWMMMLPDGHVTGIGLSRNEQLKALGNGVVVQQALAALERLVPIAEQVAS